MDAPGGRYKIVERGRRLVTIDTLTGQEVTTMPTASTPPITDTGRDKVTAAPKRNTGSAMGGPSRGEQAMGTSPRPAPTTLAKPRGIMLTLAGFVPGARFDSGDRVILMTKTYYDPRGPRELRLTAEKTNSLGGLVIAAMLIALVAVFLIFSGSFVIVFVIGFVALRSSKSLLKPMFENLISDAEELR